LQLRNNNGSLAAPPLGELPNNLLTSKPGAACPPEIFTNRLVLLLGLLYDENMLELFILYKLSDIRQEIAEQEDRTVRSASEPAKSAPAFTPKASKPAPTSVDDDDEDVMAYFEKIAKED
jgi:hypothetical protein